MNTRILGLQLGLLKSASAKTNPNRTIADVLATRSPQSQNYFARNPDRLKGLGRLTRPGAPYAQSPGIANIKKPSTATPVIGSLPNPGMGKTPFTNPTNLPIAGQLPAGVVGAGNKPGVAAPVVPPIPPMESFSASTSLPDEGFAATLKTLTSDPAAAQRLIQQREQEQLRAVRENQEAMEADAKRMGIKPLAMN